MDVAITTPNPFQDHSLFEELIKEDTPEVTGYVDANAEEFIIPPACRFLPEVFNITSPLHQKQ